MEVVASLSQGRKVTRSQGHKPHCCAVRLVYTPPCVYKTRLASNEIFSTSNKIHREVSRAKDLSAPLYVCVCVCVCVYIYIYTHIYIYIYIYIYIHQKTSVNKFISLTYLWLIVGTIRRSRCNLTLRHVLAEVVAVEKQ